MGPSRRTEVAAYEIRIRASEQCLALLGSLKNASEVREIKMLPGVLPC